MNCKNCKIFYTDSFNHFTGYCKQTDRFCSGHEKDCPCGQNLTKLEKILLEVKDVFFKINKTIN